MVRPACRALRSGLCILSAIVLFSCDSNPTDPLPPLLPAGPIVSAGADTSSVVASTFFLNATATPGDRPVVAWSWVVLHGSDTLAVLDTSRASLRTPFFAGDTLICIATATDDSGRVGRDTMSVEILSWLIQPDSAAVYHVGDTMRIFLRPVYETLGLKLLLLDGEEQVDIPGLTSAIIPALQPDIWFVIPDSIRSSSSGPMLSTIGSCARIQVFNYSASYESVQSNQCQTILARRAPAVVFAGNDTIVMPESTIVLRASLIDPGNTVQSIEWLIPSADTFAVIAGRADTAISAPRSFSSGYPILVRATDNRGNIAYDTMNVIVSWIIGPNGGEIFSIGDTMQVDLFRFNELCSIKLIIDRGGDLLSLNVPGLNNMFVPNDIPTISFAIPDSIYDQVYGWVNMATDSCRVRILRYLEPSYFVDSALPFTILARG